MFRTKTVVLILVSISIAAAAVSGAILWRNQASVPSASIEQTSDESSGFMLVYLPVTRSLSTYYDLDIPFGALVTAISPGSTLEQAGLKEGDIILSVNGIRLEGSTLPGVLRECSIGDRITLAIWREETMQIIQVVYAEE